MPSDHLRGTRSDLRAVPSYIWAAFVAWVRAKILKDDLDKARRRLERPAAKRRPEPKPTDITDAFRFLTYLELWLGALQVVVEAYERSYKHPDSVLSDPVVDRLLDPERRAQLRRYRNTVFHVDSRDHADALAVLGQYKNFIEWGGKLMKELGRVIVARAVG